MAVSGGFAWMVCPPMASLLGVLSVWLSMNWVFSGWMCMPLVSSLCSTSFVMLCRRGRLVAQRYVSSMNWLFARWRRLSLDCRCCCLGSEGVV